MSDALPTVKLPTLTTDQARKLRAALEDARADYGEYAPEMTAFINWFLEELPEVPRE